MREICERNEQTVEKLMHALSGKEPDYDTVGSLFAEDGYYWALTPVSPQVHGPQAIIDDLKRQFAMGGDLESRPPHALVSSNNHVVLERTDYVTVTVNQRRAPLRICAVFEFDGDGKIKAWREYWDKAHCIEKMGFSGSNYSAAPAAAESGA